MLFHRIVAKILTASLFLLFSGCSSDSLSNGDDMSFAKSATGSLLSKAGLSVQMQDDFDGRAQNFTVQFFVSNRTGYIAPSVPPNPIIPPPIAAGNITPVGEILWTIGGNTQRRLVSIYDGAAITGVAEHFNINAVDDTDLSDSSNQTLYDVTITAAGGVRGSTSLRRRIGQLRPSCCRRITSPLPREIRGILPGHAIPMQQCIDFTGSAEAKRFRQARKEVTHGDMD